MRGGFLRTRAAVEVIREADAVAVSHLRCCTPQTRRGFPGMSVIYGLGLDGLACLLVHAHGRRGSVLRLELPCSTGFKNVLACFVQPRCASTNLYGSQPGLCRCGKQFTVRFRRCGPCKRSGPCFSEFGTA
eukprot:scaffold123101_cov19-Tisochrysis_lutea.AAC.1